MPSKSAVGMPLALRNIMLTQVTPFISFVNIIHRDSEVDGQGNSPTWQVLPLV